MKPKLIINICPACGKTYYRLKTDEARSEAFDWDMEMGRITSHKFTCFFPLRGKKK